MFVMFAWLPPTNRPLSPCNYASKGLLSIQNRPMGPEYFILLLKHLINHGCSCMMMESFMCTKANKPFIYAKVGTFCIEINFCRLWWRFVPNICFTWMSDNVRWWMLKLVWESRDSGEYAMMKWAVVGKFFATHHKEIM